MKYYHLGRLNQIALARKPGYMAALQKVGAPVSKFGMPYLAVSDQDAAAIRREFALSTPQTFSSFATNHKSTPPSGKIIRLGDLIGKIATPIARALKMDCIDKTTGELKPESGCQQRKDAANKIKLPFNVN